MSVTAALPGSVPGHLLLPAAAPPPGPGGEAGARDHGDERAGGR